VFPLFTNTILSSVTTALTPLAPVYMPLIFVLVNPSLPRQLLPPKKEIIFLRSLYNLYCEKS